MIVVDFLRVVDMVDVLCQPRSRVAVLYVPDDILGGIPKLGYRGQGSWCAIVRGGLRLDSIVRAHRLWRMDLGFRIGCLRGGVPYQKKRPRLHSRVGVEIEKVDKVLDGFGVPGQEIEFSLSSCCIDKAPKNCRLRCKEVLVHEERLAPVFSDELEDIGTKTTVGWHCQKLQENTRVREGVRQTLLTKKTWYDRERCSLWDGVCGERMGSCCSRMIVRGNGVRILAWIKH